FSAGEGYCIDANRGCRSDVFRHVVDEHNRMTSFNCFLCRPKDTRVRFPVPQSERENKVIELFQDVKTIEDMIEVPSVCVRKDDKARTFPNLSNKARNFDVLPEDICPEFIE